MPLQIYIFFSFTKNPTKRSPESNKSADCLNANLGQIKRISIEMFNEDGKREKGKNDELADEFFVCSEEL